MREGKLERIRTLCLQNYLKQYEKDPNDEFSLGLPFATNVKIRNYCLGIIDQLVNKLDCLTDEELDAYINYLEIRRNPVIDKVEQEFVNVTAPVKDTILKIIHEGLTNGESR